MKRRPWPVGETGAAFETMEYVLLMDIGLQCTESGELI